ncbi:MAG: DUF6311 domain-containing protein [Dokdonella sp.]
MHAITAKKGTLPAAPAAGAALRAARVTRVLAVVSLLIGCLLAAMTLDRDYVSGHGRYWQSQLGDPAKGEIGWFYYARDAWRFPLFDSRNTHYPEGSSVVLADSLPLLALPVKLAYQVFWPGGSDPPIYTGWWVAMCLVLQAVCASRLLRALGIEALLPHLAGVVIFCWMPIVFLRFGQAALMGQFLILFALEGYVRAKRHGLSRGQVTVQCLLPAFGLLVTPYLAVMAGAVIAATILDAWRERRLAFRDVLLCFGGIVASSLLVMALGGFFTATRSQFGDYGLYSMNLLSPWVPFPQTQSGQWLGTTMPVITGSNQWEGGAWFGAGMLLLGLFAIPALRDLRANLRRHAVLAGVLVLVVAFAISHRIGIGSREVLTLPISDGLLAALSQLRGSGRFVWVASYALLAALVVAVCARYRPRTAAMLLAAAALLQVLDARPMQVGVRDASASPAPSTIDVATWARLIGAHARIFQFPSFECGGLFGHGVPGNKFRGVEIDWIAARLDVPTNSAYLARFTKDCDRERAEAMSDHGAQGVLYLYRSSDDIGAPLIASGVDTRQCGFLDDVVVCSRDVEMSALR